MFLAALAGAMLLGAALAHHHPSGGGQHGRESVRGVIPSATPAPRARPPRARAHSTAVRWLAVQKLRTALARLSATSGARMGVALQSLGGGSPVTVGSLQTGAAWSTMKIPVVMARYKLAAARGEDVGVVAGRVAAAVTASDNAAAQSLFDDMIAAKSGLVPASRFVQGILRAVGDRETVVNTRVPAGGFSTFGQTTWSLRQGVKFFRALANRCLAPKAADSHVLDLMGHVIASQRWGFGATDFARSAATRFKGGWGPMADGAYLVRQFAVVSTPAHRGAVVGIMVTPRDGSFASGTALLTRIGRLVADSLKPGIAPTGRCARRA